MMVMIEMIKMIEVMMMLMMLMTLMLMRVNQLLNLNTGPLDIRLCPIIVLVNLNNNTIIILLIKLAGFGAAL